MWQAEFKLYLYSDDPRVSCNRESLISALKKCEFIGDEIGKESSKKRYETGENFLSLLCFMGCSPNIELAPQNDKPYCYIEIETARQTPIFLSGKNLRKVQCPECKQRISDIGMLITTALDNNTASINCPHCHHRINYKNINWRKTGFIASSWIVVGNIYESEAVPDDNLLNSLEKVTGTRWKFAYIRKLSEQ